MTLIVASSAGPTDAQFAALNEQVDRLAAIFTKEHLTGKIQEVVEQAIRPIAAEIALMEKEMGVRAGMMVNRRAPANDDFADVDLNAAMNSDARDAYLDYTPNLHVANATAQRLAGAKAARERLANTKDEFTGYDLNADMGEKP